MAWNISGLWKMSALCISSQNSLRATGLCSSSASGSPTARFANASSPPSDPASSADSRIRWRASRRATVDCRGTEGCAGSDGEANSFAESAARDVERDVSVEGSADGMVGESGGDALRDSDACSDAPPADSDFFAFFFFFFFFASAEMTTAALSEMTTAALSAGEFEENGKSPDRRAVWSESAAAAPADKGFDAGCDGGAAA